MITIPAPKDEPVYSPETRAYLREAFESAHLVLEMGQCVYICYALKLVNGRGSVAHDLIDRRLGRMPDGAQHTYITWNREQNRGVSPVCPLALRLLWLRNLIEEFSQ